MTRGRGSYLAGWPSTATLGAVFNADDRSGGSTVAQRAVVGAIALATVALWPGCGPAPLTGPQAAAHDYLLAVADGRGQDAWRLRAAAVRARTTPTQVQQHLDSLPTARRQTIRAEAGRQLATRREITWRSGSEWLRLRDGGGGRWSVVGALPRFDRQGTPKDALDTFARAFRGRDWATLIKLAPREEAAELTPGLLQRRLGDAAIKAEVNGALDALESAGAGEQSAAHQWTFSAGRHRAILVLEEGAWRVLDIR